MRHGVSRSAGALLLGRGARRFRAWRGVQAGHCGASGEWCRVVRPMGRALLDGKAPRCVHSAMMYKTMMYKTMMCKIMMHGWGTEPCPQVPKAYALPGELADVYFDEAQWDRSHTKPGDAPLVMPFVMPLVFSS